ncbi:MAG: phosphatidate cytidylyltransferase [Pseudomonadota bacterium]|nr:phosphatidate cytidylyltransferase [Pseudomonadota bacterium]
MTGEELEKHTPKISASASVRRDGFIWRIASAAVLAPAALAAVFAGGALFAAAVAFCAIIMLFEWTRMVEGRDFTPIFYVQALAAVGALVAASAGKFELAFGLCAAAAAAGAVLEMRADTQRASWIAFGPAYILAPSVALIWLRTAVENGQVLTLMLFLIVWAADSGGYFGGRLVGGPKMSPALSPAKTWAGAVGGVIFGALAGFGVARAVFGEGATGFYILAGASLGLASILGDMAESGFKRIFGVKDASGLIPGHGGFLDRLDGMIFATTAMTLVLFLHMIGARVYGVQG